MKKQSLGELIERHVSLGPEAATGFRGLVCPLCNDHSPRAGFKIQPDVVVYRCFNCGAKVWYEEGSGELIKTGQKLLIALGIPKADVDRVLSSCLFGNLVEKREDKVLTLDALRNKVSTDTPTISLPALSAPLGSPHHLDLQAPLLDYLHRRKVDPVAVKAHFSTHPRFMGRVIIPFYRGGRVIYWQARAVDQGVKPRYLSATTSRSAVLYNYDALARWSTQPLFVTEGVFDAMGVDGVALLGSSISAAQLEVLRACKRRLVFVIDRDNTGEALAKQVGEAGWETTFVDARAADINDSICRWGRIYTTWHLLTNISRPRPGSLDTMQLQLQLLEGRMRR
jgi:hypothetical protein